MIKLIVFILPFVLTAGCRSKFQTKDSDVSSAVATKNPAVSLSAVQDFVSRTLKTESNPLGIFYSFESICLDVSAQWMKRLNNSGLRGALQETSGVVHLNVSGRRILRSPTHFFIAFNPGTPQEILLDATYGQFIEGAEKLSNLPLMLVSPTAEIKPFFAKYKKLLRVETHEDEHTGLYDTDEWAEMIYSTGRFSKNRKSYQ